MISYDLSFNREEAMQMTAPVDLTRDTIHERAESFMNQPLTSYNRAILPLAKSIQINKKARFPLLTVQLPLYLSPRCVELPGVGTIMLSRTKDLENNDYISPEASDIIRARFKSNFLHDLQASMEACRPYMAVFDIRLRPPSSSSFKVVGALVLRKYGIRCFGVSSQALFIDCIGIDKGEAGQGIGSAVLDMLYDVVRQGNTDEDRMPCYIFAQCVRDKFWDLRANNTHEARALVFQVYMLDPMREHIYKDCTPRAIQVFNPLKGQSPSRVSD